MTTTVVIVALEEFRRTYDKGFTKKNLICSHCSSYFPTNSHGRRALASIVIGLIAMLAMHELLKMRGLETMTMEGLLTLFATFALTIPLENYLTFLPVDGNVVAYSVLISIMLGTTVFSKSYTIEDAVFPLAMSFYVGFGFNALLDARVAGLDKALLALCIVWATDSGAYLAGMTYGKRKLAPTVSPNKNLRGSLRWYFRCNFSNHHLYDG